MPRDLSALFVEENAKLEQSKLLHLITLQIDDETSINIVDSNYDITYGGVLYVKFPVAFSDISANSDGSIAKASMTVANVSREMQAYVEQHKGLRNRRVVVKTVYEKFVDYVYTVKIDGSIDLAENPNVNLSSYISDEFLIDSYTSDETVINFQLDPVIDLQVKVPRRRYTSMSCYWKYKDGHTCRYSYNTKGTIHSGSNILTVEYLEGLHVGKSINIGNTSTIYIITEIDTESHEVTLDKESDITMVSTEVSLVYCDKTYTDCKAHKRSLIPTELCSSSGDSFMFSGMTEESFKTIIYNFRDGDIVKISSGAEYIIKHFDVVNMRIVVTEQVNPTIISQIITLISDNTLRFGGFPGISGNRAIYI